MWIVYTAGYAVLAYAAFVIFRNNYLTTKYREKLKGSTDIWDMEHALSYAKIHYDLDIPFLVLASVFWVVCLPSLGLYKIATSLPRIPVFRSAAEKEVDNYKAKKALSDKRKTEWQAALRTMDEAGIDTKELRKIKID